MRLLVLITFFVFVYIDNTQSWGEIGHRTTARIAQEYLNKNALNNINKILGMYKGPNGKEFKTIYDIATYPDEIRDIVPWANTYHYLNMNKDVNKYNESTQCSPPSYCIVIALQNYTSILRDRSINDISLLGEALSFTTHFMGDFFQPLHAGHTEDVGGTTIKITKFTNDWVIDTTSSDLHWCWDHLVLLHWMNAVLKKTELTDVYDYYLKKVEENQDLKKEYLSKKVNFVSIAEDSRDIVLKDVYSKIENYDLNNFPIKYYEDTIELIEKRVIKSGLQMASLFNDIFDERSNSANTSKKGYFNIITFFLILFLFIKN